MNTFPKLALGTWLIGGTKDPDPNNDDAKDIAIIQLAIENDVTLIDTAQNYANGRCEELVGLAVKDLPRESFQILTKQFKDRLTYQNVIDDCAASLKRLGVEYIDYFACHAPNSDFNPKNFFKATNELVKQGKVKNVGVSNFGPKMLKIAVEESETPITFNQVFFNFSDDDVLSTGTYDFCIDNGIRVQAYRILVELDENKEAHEILGELSVRYNCSVQEIAVAYINSYEGLSFTIKSSSRKHWDSVKEALKLELKPDDIARLRESHRDIEGTRRHFLIM
jgi:diketogulonate reductase-like aldo/keto reductase